MRSTVLAEFNFFIISGVLPCAFAISRCARYKDSSRVLCIAAGLFIRNAG